jgi:hypothetical protein
MFTTACTTTMPTKSSLNVPSPDNKPRALEAKGDLSSTYRRVESTVVDGKTTKMKETTEQSASNAADAKHEEEMARIEAKRAIKIAQAQNPAPVYVVPVQYSTQSYSSSSSSHHCSTRRNPPRSNRRSPTRRSSGSDAGQNVWSSTKGH